MAKRSYVFYEDAGHGWLKVERAELVKLGIARYITSFSYQRGVHVYLEEDQDATLFIKEKEKLGEGIRCRVRVSDRSHIRGYDPYQFVGNQRS